MKLQIFLPAMVLVLSFSFASCTHLDRPSERLGQSGTHIDYGTTPPVAHDRARHYISGKRPFEWWYFDGHLDSGETFSGTFLDPNFADGRPGAAFSLYSSNWKRRSIFKTLDASDMKTSTEDVDVTCSAGYVKRIDEKTYRVGWNMDGLKVDFTLTELAPGWMPHDDRVNEDQPDFFWAIHQARNKVEGTITENGTVRHVTGTGYADHNWGKKPFNEIARRWVWGRILAGDYTIVYADVDYIDPSLEARPLYIARGDRQIVGTGSPVVKQWDFTTHPVLLRHYPRQISVEYTHGGIEAHLHIRHKALVEEIDLLTISGLNPLSQWIARTFVARPTYFRIIADYDGTITENGKTETIEGECLYEVMGFE